MLRQENGLYIKLSEFMFKNKKNDVNFSIAKVMIAKIHDFPDVTIEQIAYLSNTTCGSVTKFCKKLGFSGFSEVRYYKTSKVNNPITNIIKEAVNVKETNEQFLGIVNSGLSNIFNIFDQQQILRISKKLLECKTVTIISGMHGFSANNLARELFDSFGISCYEIYRGSDYSMIENVIESTDFTFIISLTGKWIDNNWEKINIDPNLKQQITLISYDQTRFQYFDECVTFEQFTDFYSTTYFSSHTVQSFFISLLIQMSILMKK